MIDFSLQQLLKHLTLYFPNFLQYLESVIKARIPSILSTVNKNIDELENEMNQLGRPIAVDAGVRTQLHCFMVSIV